MLAHSCRAEMMKTLKENNASATPQSIHSNGSTINRSYSTIAYDHQHHHPWEKPNYAIFNYPSYSIETMSSTGSLSSLATTNKNHSSFDPIHPTFYRRHTESVLPTISTSIYSSFPTTHSSPSPFNYSHPTTHYHPPELFFGWNNCPSLMRTHSASFRDYSPSTGFYPINSLSGTNHKSTEGFTSSGSTANHYPSFLNTMPPINFSVAPSAGSVPSNSISSHRKHPISSSKKRPRLTAQLRNEILKLKAHKPTIFAWEIQQNLLQNGVCTAQTLPQTTVIQRILNEFVSITKEEPKTNVDLVVERIFPKSSPVTVCLSPSQSPALSVGESGSECSICLENYRSGQEVSILSCSHEYHSSCIKEWMMKNRSCPMCRKDIRNQPQFVTLLI